MITTINEFRKIFEQIEINKNEYDEARKEAKKLSTDNLLRNIMDSRDQEYFVDSQIIKATVPGLRAYMDELLKREDMTVKQEEEVKLWIEEIEDWSVKDGFMRLFDLADHMHKKNMTKAPDHIWKPGEEKFENKK